MRVSTIVQIEPIKSEDPAEFNEKMEELSEYNNVSYELSMDGGTFSAVIVYEITKETVDRASDIFHQDGVRYTCKQCPHIEDPHRGNVKWCKCEFSVTGRTHKDHECCELFYKELLQGDIEPLPEYVR